MSSRPEMVIEFVEDEEDEEEEDFESGDEEGGDDGEDGGFGEEEGTDIFGLGGNEGILEAIESLGSLQQQESDEGGVEHVAEYKRRTKDLLERLLRKLTEDVAIRRALEDEVEVLEESLVDKDAQIVKLSEKAHQAIDECKAQAEEMADDFMAKVETEVSARSSLENIIRRLQCQVSSLRGELGMFKAASRACKAAPSIEERFLSIRIENESLKLQNQDLKAELEQTRETHNAEIKTLGACCESFEKKFHTLKAAWRKTTNVVASAPP